MDLTAYDVILVNTSGGKDSQTTFRVDLSLDEIERAVERGEGAQAGKMTGAWNM